MVSKARLVITAFVVEGRSQAEVAHSYGVSKGWVSKLVARWRAEGDSAFQPRSRRPKTSQGGNVTLRLNGTLHHIAIGRAHTGTRIIMLVADLDVRVIHAATGEILRHLTLDPERRYHGTGQPVSGPRRPYGPPKSETNRTLTQVRPFPMS